MDGNPSILTLTVVGLAFVLAGFVKGVLGLGLPTVAIGLLSIVMLPAQAAALLSIPTVLTNVWQMWWGPSFGVLLRRLWPMYAGVCVGIWLGAGWLVADNGGKTLAALGIVLMFYAILGLTAVRFYVSPRAESWLTPLIGLASGLVSAATGVFGMPAVPYLQALGLDKDDLVQALGMSFTISALVLGIVLVQGGVLHLSNAGASVIALAPAFFGMWLGQILRSRMRPETFRLCFLIGLLLLGAHLALREVI